MTTYDIPANIAELVTAVGIPHACLVDHHAVPHQTDLVNKLGVSSVEIIARTVRYSGTFFEAAPAFKTEYHLLQSSTWTVQVELVTIRVRVRVRVLQSSTWTVQVELVTVLLKIDFRFGVYILCLHCCFTLLFYRLVMNGVPTS